MSKVLSTDPNPQMFIEMGQKLLPDGATFEAVPSLDLQLFAQLAADADILFVLHRRIDAELLALAPRVRLIQRLGAGYQNIDIAATNAAGIPAAYTPGATAGVVAEHTIMLMLVLLKHFVAAEQGTRMGGWPGMQLTQAGIGDLGGSTIGLVGMGNIGRAVAERLAPFGTRLVYTSRQRADAATESKYQVTYLSLPELLAASQIVSLHLPLTNATHHLISDEQLALMARGSLLINVSRGGLVDEAALRRAIESGHLAGAALDVLEQEGDGGNPFTDLPQVIVTPHIGGSTLHGIKAGFQHSFGNINRVLAGNAPQYLIPGSS